MLLKKNSFKICLLVSFMLLTEVSEAQPNIYLGHAHPAYNPSFSACFFSQNSIFLSQQISQQCFSAGLLAQPNEALILVSTATGH
jgi:hypothetical protein